MNSCRQLCLAVLLIIAVGLFVSVPAFAEEPPAEADASAETAPTAAPNPGTPTAAEADAHAQTAPTAAPDPGTPTADDGWHFAITPYLWFAGMSGTVDAFGRDISVHVSPGDLLSHFQLGFMAFTEVRKNRVVVPLDFLWIKLQENKALQFDEGATSVNFNMKQLLLSPRVGYRIVDNEKVKIDTLVGISYWHIQENVNFQPSGLGDNFSPSLNWVDGIAGMNFEFALSPKAGITIAGDAGGGGAEVEYQVVGALGFKVSKSVVLDLGYRYLDTNYRTNAPKLIVFDSHMSGALLGVTFNLK
jgi:opacity protein-like surface antigen